ncbi:sulfite exporter TauE/SafE family protein [Thioalkalivibrio thiocyanodenitrificans]|uniref:sulfite exporter TauE/SafE family protein n=1 Tax=Thioalkalivibrio thiocyanodenitrificans TaxID=243063 RepID=UPI000373E2A4|nr:sulfite exporter TauE/SafE family protein [Thioalkalivibrio thiocyanodenitrificans]
MIEHGTLIAAFVVGLLGGVHCAGMCGGIVAALSLGTARPEISAGDAPRGASPHILLAYNVGRILSYVVAGAIAGGAGWFATRMMDVNQAQLVLQILAGLFMVALGLYLAGWWHGLARVERAGGVLWRRLEPLGRRFMPVRSPRQAVLLGLVWGWLPCGLVYSVLIWSISAGGALQGAALMGAFGLGTLPNLLLMGAMAARLGGVLRAYGVRTVAGLMVAGFGLYMLAQVWRAWG